MKTLVTAPENLAVSLSDVKAQIRMETTFTAQDGLLTGYIEAAVGYVENICGRKLISQTWRLDLTPGSSCPLVVLLPFGRAQTVTAITWTDEAGETTTIDTGDYELVHIDDERSAVRFDEGLNFSEAYHTNPLSIVFVTGYGDSPDDIPAEIRLALLLIVSHYYTNGLPTMDDNVERAIFSMLNDFRLRRTD